LGSDLAIEVPMMKEGMGATLLNVSGILSWQYTILFEVSVLTLN